MMEEEFRRIGANAVSSACGFIVEVNPSGGILYSDNTGKIQIDSEWLVKPHQILLYLPKPDAVRDRVNSILPALVRALEYLGHPVEVWPD
jgi:hypothetical protein